MKNAMLIKTYILHSVVYKYHNFRNRHSICRVNLETAKGKIQDYKTKEDILLELKMNPLLKYSKLQK